MKLERHVLLRSQKKSTLLDHFYSGITESGLAAYSQDQWCDYCEWKGLSCNGGRLSSVFYEKEKHGNYNVHSLPPSVISICISQCQQTYRLHTRALPRALQRYHLSTNQLFGCVDLRTLPGNLLNLDISFNRLNGPIDLTSLPRGLQHLWMHKNAIQQSVVFYGDLPPSIFVIKLVGDTYMGKDNQIGELRALHPRDPVNDSTIFESFPPKHICSA